MDKPTLIDFVSTFGIEMIVGGMLMIFGFVFSNWARSLRNSTDRILSKLEGLVVEFHHHRVDIENRVTRVETKVDIEAAERREHRAAVVAAQTVDLHHARD
jgi:hypothetical protein